MSRFPILGLAFALFGLLLTSVACGQERGRTPETDDIAALKKRIANLENELSTVRKELREVQEVARPDIQVKVIPLKGMNVKETAKALRKIHRNHVDCTIQALPDLNCLIVRADAKLMKEIIDILTLVKPLGDKQQRPDPK